MARGDEVAGGIFGEIGPRREPKSTHPLLQADRRGQGSGSAEAPFTGAAPTRRMRMAM